VPAAAARVVRTLAATLRLRVVGSEHVTPLWRAGQPVIYAVWHGRILMCPWVNERLRESHGARAVTALVSRSRDGELIARYVERFAMRVVRGSSTRGGAMALRALAATLRQHGDVVIIPDGPRGPRRQVAPGVVALAARSGAPIIPFAISARPAITTSTWDAFQIPLPFARLAVAFGPVVTVSADADREAARADIAAALDAITAASDRLAAGEQPGAPTGVREPAPRERSA
jgi:lysophospholipid acyltransferase (LPLAT)-like uncharacterized protein